MSFEKVFKKLHVVKKELSKLVLVNDGLEICTNLSVVLWKNRKTTFEVGKRVLM